MNLLQYRLKFQNLCCVRTAKKLQFTLQVIKTNSLTVKLNAKIALRASEINTAAEPSLECSQLLFRGGLSIPSRDIKHYVCNGFAVLELFEHILLSPIKDLYKMNRSN